MKREMKTAILQDAETQKPCLRHSNFGRIKVGASCGEVSASGRSALHLPVRYLRFLLANQSEGLEKVRRTWKFTLSAVSLHSVAFSQISSAGARTRRK